MHVFRHSCATRLAIAGIDANRIKEWMDHSSLLVTQRYVKLSPKNLEVGAEALDGITTPAKLKVVKKRLSHNHGRNTMSASFIVFVVLMGIFCGAVSYAYQKLVLKKKKVGWFRSE
ncbi:tyrosine-type recombinase/integrase [Mesorhizobium australicum]|uniref:tyrosine-type recombinase/integrase n=1 Tax=Mesorhizobium australicum TaxID=536018 RepID=UPI0033386054